MSNLTLGSLFSGSGGFEFGGLISGITPVWASEVEPFPICVTTKRMPFVRHYGDVSGMDGGNIEPVDIITFGSPCQDMSIAGKRSGLGGDRSSLFYEAVRIIKEMRCATNGRYPRYIVWENVPGAFSSNGGEDFRCVLEEICKIKDERLSVPESERWTNAGEILGDGFSLAWRVLDAQYWGVPQRRKRIFLVADFADESAGKILFDSESLPGHLETCFRAWQRAAGSPPPCTGSAGALCLNDQGGARMDVSEDVSSTLRAEDHGHPPCVVESAGFCTEHSAGSRGIGYEAEKSPTLRAGVVPAALTLWENHSQDTRYTGPLDTAPTVSSTYGTGGNNQPFVVGDTPKTMKIRSGCEGGGKGILVQEDKSATLACANDQTVFVPKAYGISSFCSNAMLSDNPHAGIYEAETSRTLDCSGGSPTANQGGVCVVEREACYDIRQTSDGTKVSRNHCYETETARSLGTDHPDPAGNHGGVAVVEKAYSIQGNMIGRDDKNGPQGDGINEDVSFTLNATDHHAVYAMTTGCFTHVEEEKTPTLMARDYKDPTTVAPVPGTEPQYTVRRLTPVECARLQGFPDWWCSGLENPNPTDEELAFWTDVWEMHRKVVTHASKPKTERQIRKWLADPYSDSAAYKMWGNGVAEPCVVFVLAGIVYYSQLSAD